MVTNSKGMTLIEVIIAIVLIAVLATVGMTVYSRAMEKGKVRAIETEVAGIIKNMGQRYESAGAVSWEQLFNSLATMDGWSKPYKLPSKPAVGKAYYVDYEKDGTCYGAGISQRAVDCLVVAVELNDPSENDLIQKALNELKTKGVLLSCTSGGTTIRCIASE